MSAEKVPKIPFIPKINSYCTTIEDCIRVNSNYVTGDLPNLLPSSVQGIGDIVKEGATLAADRPCLGSHTSPTEPYTWMTYAECYTRLKHFGSGLQEFEDLSATPWRCVGIYGINCSDWVIAQYACASYRLTSVPLYDTLGDEAILHICNQADLSTVVCDTPARASKLFALTSSLECLKHIIIMKPGSEEMNSLKDKAGTSVQIHTFDEIVALGTAHPKEVLSSGPDDLILICYTSGTTGLPKGVMIPNKMMLASLNNNMLNAGIDILTEHDVYLSYLPLAHIFEQMFVLLTLCRHGRVGFYSGDPRTLTEDARALRPTVLTVVPRVLLRVYEGVQKKLGNSALRRWLFKKAMEAKCKDVDRNVFNRNTMWDVLFFSKVRALFGDRVRWITCGGAPLAPHVLRFTRAAFSCWVFEGYGSTETAGSMSISMASDLEGGHVGAPVPGLQLKLADVPSMDIVVSRDKKGEICVRGPSCTPGYYKDPEKTAELLDSEGWMHTGDVAVWTEVGPVLSSPLSS
uniref:long-chain-fatty-acid--CoA ligase n=2 Tax=Schistocephalus solidus TaxID=70667 RepID=A0A0X3PKE7_SCHSO